MMDAKLSHALDENGDALCGIQRLFVKGSRIYDPDAVWCALCMEHERFKRARTWWTRYASDFWGEIPNSPRALQHYALPHSLRNNAFPLAAILKVHTLNCEEHRASRIRMDQVERCWQACACWHIDRSACRKASRRAEEARDALITALAKFVGGEID